MKTARAKAEVGRGGSERMRVHVHVCVRAHTCLHQSEHGGSEGVCRLVAGVIATDCKHLELLENSL